MQIEDLKIVLVDDTSSVRKGIWFLLTSIGVLEKNIRQAENGAQAFGLLEMEDAHLVWTDTNMPVMDGLQLTQAIRQKEENTDKHTVIIVTSGNEYDEKALKIGADMFLRKPFGLEVIESTINTVLLCIKQPAPPPASAHGVPEAHP